MHIAYYNYVKIEVHKVKSLPVQVAAMSKAWVCGRSPAEIVGSNTPGGMDVCLLRVVCVVR
jgi:hypothetical protein